MKNAFDTREFLQWDELDTESDDYINNTARKQNLGRGKKEKTLLDDMVVAALILKYVSLFVVLPIFLIWILFIA